MSSSEHGGHSILPRSFAFISLFFTMEILAVICGAVLREAPLREMEPGSGHCRGWREPAVVRVTFPAPPSICKWGSSAAHSIMNRVSAQAFTAPLSVSLRSPMSKPLTSGWQCAFCLCSLPYWSTRQWTLSPGSTRSSCGSEEDRRGRRRYSRASSGQSGCTWGGGADNVIQETEHITSKKLSFIFVLLCPSLLHYCSG